MQILSSLTVATDEFMKNEVSNVFGNSNVIFFSKESEASAIIKSILSDKRFLQSKKKAFLRRNYQ